MSQRVKINSAVSNVRDGNMSSGQRAILRSTTASNFPTPVHLLQQSIGNKATRSLLNEEILQAKLRIAPSHDEFEQEADRVANQVMHMPESAVTDSSVAPYSSSTVTVQRKCEKCSEEDQIQRRTADEDKEPEEDPVEESLARRKSLNTGEDGNLPSSIPGGSWQMGGMPMAPMARGYFEPRFDRNFGDVRFHVDNRAAQIADSINARAFTIGPDIYFGAGQYQPGTSSGRHLIAHELTHVVQQGRSRPRFNDSAESNDTEIPSQQPQTAIEKTSQRIGSSAFTVSTVSPVIQRAADGEAEQESSGFLERFGEAVGLGPSALATLVRTYSPGLADLIERGPLAIVREKIEAAVSGWLTAAADNINIGSQFEGLRAWVAQAFSTIESGSSPDETSCKSFAKSVSNIFGFATRIVEHPALKKLGAGLQAAHDLVATIVGTVVEAHIANVSFVWNAIKDFAGMIRGWIRSAKDAIGSAWNAVASFLGISDEGPGLFDWLKEKANQAWQMAKDNILPNAIEGLRQAGSLLYQFSPLRVFHELIQAGRSFIGAMQWFWENRNDPNLAVTAANDPQVKDTILPRVIELAQGFGNTVANTFSSFSAKAVELASGLLEVVSAITGVPLLRGAYKFVARIQKLVGDLSTWATETLPSIVENVKSSLSTTWQVAKKILSALVLLVASPPQFAASAGWLMLPDCYKPPLINHVLDLLIKILRGLPDLPLFGPLWSLFKPGYIAFLETIREKSDEEKVQLLNKIAGIMLFSGVDFVMGFVVGFLRGVWESLSGPFQLVWMAGKGLFKLAVWISDLAHRTLGTRGQTATPADPTNLDPEIRENERMDRELANRAGEMASELQPPAEQVRDNFYSAAQEYFGDAEGATFETLRDKLGELWDDAQTTMEGQGEELANAVVDALLSPNADAVAAQTVYRTGDIIGWLTGTIITEVVIAIFSAGTVTAANAVTKTLKAIAVVVNKIGDVFVLVFRLIGRAGRALFAMVGKLVKTIGGAGKGALKVVVDAFKTIATKLQQFAAEILAKLGPRASREASEEAADRAIREAGEELGERGARETSERVGREGVADVASRQADELLSPAAVRARETIKHATCGRCFPAGTKVLTPTGIVDISKIHRGDLVVSRDEMTGQQVHKRVIKTFVNESASLLRISIGQQSICSTSGHVWWVSGAGWTLAESLQIGDALLDEDDHIQKITLIEKLDAHGPTYNFEVQDTHTYYVTASASYPAIWVHNDSVGIRVLRPDQVYQLILPNITISDREQIRAVIGRSLDAKGNYTTELKGLFSYLRGGGGAGFQGVTKSAVDQLEVVLQNVSKKGGGVVAAIDLERIGARRVFDLNDPRVMARLLERYGPGGTGQNFEKMFRKLASEGVVAVRGKIPARAVQSLVNIPENLSTVERRVLIERLAQSCSIS